jgi:hypothetical protein
MKPGGGRGGREERKVEEGRGEGERDRENEEGKEEGKEGLEELTEKRERKGRRNEVQHDHVPSVGSLWRPPLRVVAGCCCSCLASE